MVGKVVSIKMNKTAVVLVESTKTHFMYRKGFLRTKKYLADDQIGVKEGDVVEISKVRPISKKKHWKIEKILGQDVVMIAKEELKEAAQEAIAEVLTEEEVKEVSKEVPKEEEKPKKRAKKVEEK